MSTDKSKIALRKLSKYFNYDRSQIAEALGASTPTVYMWFSRGKISRKMAVKAEQVTCGKVKAAELRPDIEEFKV